MDFEFLAIVLPAAGQSIAELFRDLVTRGKLQKIFHDFATEASTSLLTRARGRDAFGRWCSCEPSLCGEMQNSFLSPASLVFFSPLAKVHRMGRDEIIPRAILPAGVFSAVSAPDTDNQAV